MRAASKVGAEKTLEDRRRSGERGEGRDSAGEGGGDRGSLEGSGTAGISEESLAKDARERSGGEASLQNRESKREKVLQRMVLWLKRHFHILQSETKNNSHLLHH